MYPVLSVVLQDLQIIIYFSDMLGMYPRLNKVIIILNGGVMKGDTYTVVIGSSTPLANALRARLPDAHFFGRTNPHRLNNWHKIPSQASTPGIESAINAIDTVVKTLSANTRVQALHLVCLQGISTTDWEASINVNFRSVAQLSTHICTLAEKHNFTGSVTLIGSASSYIGGKETYASTKAALFGLMNSLQGRYKNMRTNLILPGAFEGGMTDDWDEEKKRTIGLQANARRIATSTEIADAIVFCIHNSYVSQSVINMTSGRVIMA